MKKKIYILLLLIFLPLSLMADNSDFSTAVQVEENIEPQDSSAIVTNSFWDNWYGQVGVDMTLLNPYGANFMNVFPNGKSFGVDVALGKWFTPEFGVRGRVNLENAFLKSDHAKWLEKCSDGYLTLVEDFQFNLLNIFGEEKLDRKYTLIAYPRAGAFINLKSGKGSPILGLGISNVLKLNDKWSLYGDVAYNAVTSVIGFGTDTGSGSNGYFDISIGAQLNLGKQGFHRVSEYEKHSENAVVLNSFWDNWFIQAGLGMSLLNRYGENFSDVFPNGKTFGINLGLGKWITPEVGIRGGLNWQNGIIGNRRLSWMDTVGKDPGSNHKGGGYVAVYADLFINLHNLFGGYDQNRVWNAIVFPRAGLDSNLEISSKSPLVGIGTEQTFILGKNLKLYADLAYQFTSSEFVNAEENYRGTGSFNSKHSGSNGWFDFNVGIQYEFGKNWWNKPDEKRTASHWEGGHNWPRFMVNTLASVGVGFGVKTVLKKAIKEERPDGSDKESFPSGHATMAFAAARSIDKEFRKDCIWIPIAGYAAATAVGIERIANKHHHWYDVLAGAAIGIGSAELTWWLSDLIIGKDSKFAVGTTGNTVDVAYRF